jgi:hypothetical protein
MFLRVAIGDNREAHANAGYYYSSVLYSVPRHLHPQCCMPSGRAEPINDSKDASDHDLSILLAVSCGPASWFEHEDRSILTQ